jgi:hypothetical protein
MHSKLYLQRGAPGPDFSALPQHLYHKWRALNTLDPFSGYPRAQKNRKVTLNRPGNAGAIVFHPRKEESFNMTLQRNWVTPLTTGAFLLMAVTGILIFFHMDSGLNKAAHEWLGWILIISVGLHVAVNFTGFKHHLNSRRGQLLIGTFAVLLLLSFSGAGGRDEPPFAAPVRALAEAPLATLAQVARLSPEQMRQRLMTAGISPISDQQTLNNLVGSDLRLQIRILGIVFSGAK